jgi:hypothetical protein
MEDIMISEKHAKYINRIVDKYGPTIDLRSNPESIIEIIRTFGPIMDGGDGGVGCGGVGEPDPCQVRVDVTLHDLLSAIMELQFDVAAIKQGLRTEE